MKTKTPAIPYVVWMAVFVVVPLLLIVVYAFTNYDGKFTLENFTNLDVFLQVCGNSLYLAAVATGICLLIAYPFAYFLAQTGPATRKVAMLFIMLPMWMNFLLRTYAWMSILENHGFLNQILALVGIGPLHIINTDAAVILGMVYNFLPFMILPLYSVVTYAAASKTIDFFVEGFDRSKAAFIVTEHPKHVCEALSAAFENGITTIDAKGYYSNTDRTLVYFIVNRFQVGKMRNLVHSIDPYAYIAINDVADIFPATNLNDLKGETKLEDTGDSDDAE